ncbi:4-(cytidine 5'-diphospho)-2-C-methyl-D-erythritol kinase [Rhodopseudomonas sp. NSM]|uniref:4-(cytidine 5'-diphospho)-2-C-methyl-D-erythritol kinase n=1 Tax=Rhodopseudomonas sp. NSM TaxID=3457630 RepID=UPI0040371537
MPTTALSDQARAKVNLTLRVIGRRVDGYHELESVVVFADCADSLTLAPGQDLSLDASGPRVVECGDNADNLVIKAARLLAELVPGLTTGGFALDKQLPIAAGIGGGSADAAAALRLLARANGLALDDPRLMEAAGRTGADVPVCVASASCIMSGIGEKLTPLPLPRLPAVMVNPRVGVPTKDVFAALGLKKGQLNVGITDLVAAPAWPDRDAPLGAWIAALSAVVNDLEAPARQVQPLVGEVIALLAACDGALLARMSGSGATCFAIFGSDAEAKAAAQSIQRAHPNWWVHAGTLS